MSLHIDGREGAVSHGTADGAGEGEARVEVEARGLVGIGGLLEGVRGGGHGWQMCVYGKDERGIR